MQKKILFGIAVIFVLCPYQMVSADLLQNHQFQLAAEFSHVSYEEPSEEMSEKGPFIGVFGAYTLRAETPIINVYHVDTHVNYGQVTYKSPDGKLDNIGDVMIEPRFWMGHDFALNSSIVLTPYIGAGFRYLLDHLGRASDDGGYDRRSQYFYLPIGASLVTDAFDGWKLGLNAEYDLFLYGRQTSYYSDLSTILPNLHNTQDEGYGVRGSIDFIKEMDKFNLLITPYVRHWHIKQSSTDTANNGIVILEGYEPENKSMEIGLRVGIDF